MQKILQMLSFRLVGRNLCPAAVQRFYSGRPESVPVPDTNVKSAKTTKLTKVDGVKTTESLSPKSSMTAIYNTQYNNIKHVI